MLYVHADPTTAATKGSSISASTSANPAMPVTGTSNTSVTQGNGNNRNTMETKNPVEVETYPLTNDIQQWKPTTTTNRTGEFTLQVSSGITRLEVFYTASTQIPTLTFTSTSGIYTYTSGKDEKTENGFKFITRKGLMTSNDNIRYMTIYIANTTDPGRWKLKIDVPDSLTEIACITTKVPDGWEGTTGDMLCQGTGVVFYYVDSVKSELKDDPMGSFNKLWAATEQLGANDTIEEAPEEVKDNSGMVKFIASMIILLALLSLISAMKARKKQNEKYRQKRQNIVKKENSKFKKQKSKESNELDQILSKYDADYEDEQYNEYNDDNYVTNKEDSMRTDIHNIPSGKTDIHTGEATGYAAESIVPDMNFNNNFERGGMNRNGTIPANSQTYRQSQHGYDHYAEQISHNQAGQYNAHSTPGMNNQMPQYGGMTYQSQQQMYNIMQNTTQNNMAGTQPNTMSNGYGYRQLQPQKQPPQYQQYNQTGLVVTDPAGELISSSAPRRTTGYPLPIEAPNNNNHPSGNQNTTQNSFF